MAISKLFLSLVLVFLVLITTLEEANGAISGKTRKLIDMANKNGPYLGLVIPNLFEMNPLLQHPSYKPGDLTIDYAGRRFRFGHIDNQPVVLVMTGLAMLNAGITTQLLLALFNVKGVVHYGIAGNANPSLNIGDVAIPQYWAHTALWNWQRYGDGAENELPLEVNGDYTRDIGYLKISEYSVNVTNCNSHNNLLNNIWYQPEEVFPVFGTPEDRQHIFWVPVDPRYYAIAKKLEGLKLEGCLNATTCLSHPPKVTRVHRGTSASIYLDNAAYRSFIYNKFDVSPVEMESAAVALICYQQKVPYIVIRALSDMAGGGTSESNEASTFITLAATNSVEVTVQFIKQLSTKKYQDA
uniref:Mta/sah nucleosidase n=1 Tax=Solanum tuberosum TaxID=4113 RepID=M1CU71_SOLTU